MCEWIVCFMAITSSKIMLNILDDCSINWIIENTSLCNTVILQLVHTLSIVHCYCTSYVIHHTPYNVRTQYNARRTLYCVYLTPYIVHIYSVHYISVYVYKLISYIVHYIILRCTLYNVHMYICTVYSVQCTLYRVHSKTKTNLLMRL